MNNVLLHTLRELLQAQIVGLLNYNSRQNTKYQLQILFQSQQNNDRVYNARDSYLREANDSMGISCLQARQKTLPWAGSEGSSVPHAGQKFTSVSKAAKEGILA